MKWTKTGGTGGSFQVSSDEARTGQSSVHVTSSGDDSQWRQTISLNPLLASTQYTLSFYVKGSVSSGDLLVSFRDDAGGYISKLVNGSFSDWTRLSVTVPSTTANLPYSISVYLNSCTCDIYIDDIQVDQAASEKDFQENWLHYAYAGEAADQASPGFDLEGNNNGVIDPDYLTGFEQEYVAF